MPPRQGFVALYLSFERFFHNFLPFDFAVKLRSDSYNISTAASKYNFRREKILNGKPEFENIGKSLLVRAPAKINLSLLIAGKRPDGYHELETVMAKIDLCDELLVEKSDDEGIELFCDGQYSI